MLLQSLRKGNSCSKLVTDSFKCPAIHTTPESRVSAALFSALHVIPEKIEAFLCAGDGVGVGTGHANPPAWMQSKTRVAREFFQPLRKLRSSWKELILHLW